MSLGRMTVRSTTLNWLLTQHDVQVAYCRKDDFFFLLKISHRDRCLVFLQTATHIYIYKPPSAATY